MKMIKMMEKIKALLIAFALLYASLAEAEVYRWQDASGRVFYSDNPPENARAKPVTLPNLTIADSPKKVEKPEAKKEEKQQQMADYSDFKITSPEDDNAIRANSGNVSIRIGGLPDGLNPGDEIVLYVDGKQFSSGSAMSFALSNMDRGTHSTFAVIKNATGDIVQNTAVVNFHVLRAAIRS